MNPASAKATRFPRVWLVDFGIPALLLAAFLVTRLPALGHFVTPDETIWLRRSANFYFAVSNGNWADTFQGPHPGVTTMWAGATGFEFLFPEYQRLGVSETSDANLHRLMQRRGINPIEMLAAGRGIAVLMSAAAFAATWPYARELLGRAAAALGMGMLAFAPFLVGLHRLLHVDGLLAAFMLLSLMAFLSYLKEGRVSTLLVSGMALGLSVLTKTPGGLMGLFGLSLVIRRAWVSKAPAQRKKSLSHLLVWVLSAGAAVVLLLPAIWTSPLEIFSNVVDYSLASARGEIGGPIFFNGVIYPDGNLGFSFYPIAFLWRITPLTLLGLGFALWFGSRIQGVERQTICMMGLFALAFWLLLSLGLKKFDRYLLPSHAVLILVAGWGWMQALTALQQWRWPQTRRKIARVGLFLIAGVQGLTAYQSSPYYLTYYNSWLGGSARVSEVLMVGWGEGLDQAARFLNETPGIEEKQVASWYSDAFNLIFEQRAEPIAIAPDLTAEDLASIMRNDYLVVYIHQWQRNTPANFLAAVEPLDPVFTVWIDGLEYVRVYSMESP